MEQVRAGALVTHDMVHGTGSPEKEVLLGARRARRLLTSTVNLLPQVPAVFTSVADGRVGTRAWDANAHLYNACLRVGDPRLPVRKRPLSMRVDQRRQGAQKWLISGGDQRIEPDWRSGTEGRDSSGANRNA